MRERHGGSTMDCVSNDEDTHIHIRTPRTQGKAKKTHVPATKRLALLSALERANTNKHAPPPQMAHNHALKPPNTPIHTPMHAEQDTHVYVILCIYVYVIYTYICMYTYLVEGPGEGVEEAVIPLGQRQHRADHPWLGFSCFCVIVSVVGVLMFLCDC